MEVVLHGATGLVPLGGENEYAYQTPCEDLEPVLSIEVLLFKDTYKNEPTLKRGNSILRLTPQTSDSDPHSVDD